MTMAALDWVDLAMLGVLVLSALVGAVRGLVFEVLSLLGWVAAFVRRRSGSAPMLGAAAADRRRRVGLERHAPAFACCVHRRAGRRGACWPRCRESWSARRGCGRWTALLGAAFGVVRGVLVLLALARVVAYTPALHGAGRGANRSGAAWLNAVAARAEAGAARRSWPGARSV